MFRPQHGSCLAKAVEAERWGCRYGKPSEIAGAAALRGDRGALKRLPAPLALGAVADALFVEAARKAMPGLVTAAASPAEAVEAVRTRWPALVPS